MIVAVDTLTRSGSAQSALAGLTVEALTFEPSSAVPVGTSVGLFAPNGAPLALVDSVTVEGECTLDLRTEEVEKFLALRSLAMPAPAYLVIGSKEALIANVAVGVEINALSEGAIVHELDIPAWLQAYIDACKAEVANATVQAQASAESASQSAQGAQASNASAYQAQIQAELSAKHAEISRSASLQAEEYATQAQTASTQAQTAQADAQASAEGAQASAEEARESAETATLASAQAQLSEQNAQASAESAKTSADASAQSAEEAKTYADEYEGAVDEAQALCESTRLLIGTAPATLASVTAGL